MSDNQKCMASQDGICRNVLGYGTKCSGYSDKCALRHTYNALGNLQKSFDNAIKKTFGIVGDQDE